MVGGLLLTGGSSRRMGSDKSQWRRGGETLAVRSARVLATTCHPVLEVGSGVSGLDVVREDPPGAGPLVAASAGWAALREREPTVGAAIVLAVDLPFVDEAVLRLLAAASPAGVAARVPRVGGRAQPLCARYDATAFEITVDVIAGGASSLHAWLDALTVEYLDDDVWTAVGGVGAFTDVDTAAEATGAGLERPR